jgi:hypothetical protein
VVLRYAAGARHGRVTDILLPRRFPDRIPQLFTPPLLVGTALLLRARLGAPRRRAPV